MDPIVSQLYRTLVDTLDATRPGWSETPVTVAEIYQDLVPYRRVRDAIGIDLNEDYEHALLRLLAGEGGLVRIEPDEAQAELREELDSPNPSVGIYRKFAGCDAWVVKRHDASPPVREEVQSEDDDMDAFVEQLPWEHAPAPAPPTRAPAAPPTPAQTVQPTPPQAVASAAESTQATTRCRACREPLPADRVARFCPYCGADQTPRCGECGEKLQTDWRFCIACGTPADG